jgi:hypothetical protein
VGKNCLFQFQLGESKWNWTCPISNTGLVLKNQAQNHVPSSILCVEPESKYMGFEAKKTQLAR